MLPCADVTECLLISYQTVANEIVLYDTLGWLHKVALITMQYGELFTKAAMELNQGQPGMF